MALADDLLLDDLELDDDLEPDDDLDADAGFGAGLAELLAEFLVELLAELALVSLTEGLAVGAGAVPDAADATDAKATVIARALAEIRLWKGDIRWFLAVRCRLMGGASFGERP